MEAIAVKVGEAALSAAFEVLFRKLSSPDVVKFARKKNVQAELEKWDALLRELKAVLDDAELEQITRESVKIWLNKLRDLAYDVDDVLDDFATKALQQKLIMATQPDQGGTSKVRKLVPTYFATFSTSAVKFNVKMGSKFREFTTRLEVTTKEKDAFNLKGSDGRAKSDVVGARLPSTSLVDERQIYGREEDKEAIIARVLSYDEAPFSVIPIVGMGGIGKTTLAQLVYNDQKVKGCFDLQVWVCVSEKFDISKITEIILQGDSAGVNDLNMLQEKLREKLNGKQFLLVLDDVWNEDHEKWDVLCKPFARGASGSKLIVTTRNETVVLAMRVDSPYHLKRLGEDECLQLLAKHALGAKNFNEHPTLKKVGEQIVQKCDGLPLAAKTLGALLYGKVNPNEWEDILRSKLWDLPDDRCDILPALRLSYHHLPSHLKRCFAYCAIFPKDYEFDKDVLVLLWMAEGFLDQHPNNQRNKQMEDVGNNYFDELLSRSFFQPSSTDKSKFVMHDLINDLAMLVAEGICFHLDDKKESNFPAKPLKSFRHSSFYPRRYDVLGRFEGFTQCTSLRTFLAFQRRNFQFPYRYLSNAIFDQVLSKLKCLRVLGLGSYHIKKLPHTVGDLKHLRYLDASYTDITPLPGSTTTLFNLQTLKLRGCQNLTSLPRGIGNLINLRHLDIATTPRLREMPSGVGNLTNLRLLTKFIAGGRNGLTLKELNGLSCIWGDLFVSGLDKAVHVQDERDANLRDKRGLNKLELEWIHDSSDLIKEEQEKLVLDALQPHNDLKMFTVSNFQGKDLPSWVGDSNFFTKLERLHLKKCGRIQNLPSIGTLPLLTILEIEGMHGVKSVGIEFYENCSTDIGTFTSLETLIFRDMRAWEDWSSTLNVLPKLRYFHLYDCPKLVGKLPSHLPMLKEMYIEKCPLLMELPVMLPSIDKLHLQECKGVVLRNLVNLTSLIALKMIKILDLAYMHHDLHNLASLKALLIIECEKLESLEELDLPYSLKRLKIVECNNLKYLPRAIMMRGGSNQDQCLLQELEIYGCPSLTGFPQGKIPTTLQSLSLSDCRSLQRIPDGIFGKENDDDNPTHSRLRSLCVHGCVQTLPSGQLPSTLKSCDFSNVGSIPERILSNCILLESMDISEVNHMETFPECLRNFTYLHSLSIISCPSLKCFPEGSQILRSLIALQIIHCKNLRCLPNQMRNLSSLKILRIKDCPGVASLPEGGFPPTLTDLEISNCENLMQPLFEWGLRRLTSLTCLFIDGGCPPPNIMTSLLNDVHGAVFPSTLLYLRISNLENLKSLTKGLQPPSSLETLSIYSCPKLQYLPNDAVLFTLGYLAIYGCPLLKKRRLGKKGHLWRIISQIPHFDVWEVHRVNRPNSGWSWTKFDSIRRRRPPYL